MQARLRQHLALTVAVTTAVASFILLAASSAMGAETKTFTGPTTPAHGLCSYSSGTGKLAGFHATYVVEPPVVPTVRVYALTGTYWFDRDDDSNSD
jgi:hypothetical protein